MCQGVPSALRPINAKCRVLKMAVRHKSSLKKNELSNIANHLAATLSIAKRLVGILK